MGLDPATTPIIDARLDDGSRVAICVPPASPHVAITIRRFGKRTFSAADLVEQKALPKTILKAAEQVLMTRRNILVSGGTGSGKTTLLNALIELLPVDERIVAIEDTLELRIDHSNCVRFEARGLQEGAVTIRDLVRHALRHRPDHIVVGEVRGGEAADLLQALNTGHGGSLTTVHANNAESALSRIASCAMQGGGELPWEVTCRGVVDGIAMVIHMTRHEGRRFVEEAVFVKGYEARDNQWDIQVRYQGKTFTVRLIGVDTPETKHPTETVEYFGHEATAFTKAHLEGKTVALEKDRTGDTVDRYGRLLRYVRLDGDNFNARLIREGYAHAYRAASFSKRQEFIRLEEQARRRGIGLWNRR